MMMSNNGHGGQWRHPGRGLWPARWFNQQAAIVGAAFDPIACRVAAKEQQRCMRTFVYRSPATVLVQNKNKKNKNYHYCYHHYYWTRGPLDP